MEEKNEAMEKAQRIKMIRKSLGMTQAAFGSSIGLSKRAIESYEYGYREVPERTIKDLCRVHGVSYDWLVYGDGEMLDDVGDAQAIVDACMTSDNEFAKRTLVAFASMSVEQWELIRDLIEKMK